MAKHHKEENEISAFLESPESMLRLLVKDKENRDWMLSEVTEGGPRHKQLYSSLLLARVHALVQCIEKNSGLKFSVQKGFNLTSHKEGWEIPVPLVLTSVPKAQQEELAELLSHAPAHEIIAFNALLQAIEWSISTLENGKPED